MGDFSFDVAASKDTLKEDLVPNQSCTTTTGSLPSRGLQADSENHGTHFSEPEDQSALTVSVRFACKKKKRQPTKALCSFKTLTKCDSNTSSMFLERKRWRRKERVLRAGSDKLRRTVDAYKEELRKLKEERYVSAFLEVVADAEEGTPKAVLLLEEVKNYKRKTPRWSEITVRHGIVMRHLSTKAYEYLRCEELLKLPCRTTLQKYFGTTSGEVGFSELVRSRLEAVKSCTGDQLAEVIRHVVIKTASIRFEIIRVVTDNHNINVTAKETLSGGEAKTRAPHPADPSMDIFFAFDQGHVIKNIRSQFLAKEFGENKEISSKYVKMLYNMQRQAANQISHKEARFPFEHRKNECEGGRAGPAVTAALNYFRSQLRCRI
ncbi:hypothetical protein HPB49_003538 [Dermacentor silvarum]|uniref:Uncharacterized protein n=1 Tax=Dermacentor silvarum TaxID=543639 RepID=A0ACB8CD46_DERSI|nr:hypothetical protein HPB49_003538 [Dermacentor silvarum]